MTQPGVGPITALAFVLTIGEVSRFRRGKQVASYRRSPLTNGNRRGFAPSWLTFRGRTSAGGISTRRGSRPRRIGRKDGG
jgi:transposase